MHSGGGLFFPVPTSWTEPPGWRHRASPICPCGWIPSVLQDASFPCSRRIRSSISNSQRWRLQANRIDRLSAALPRRSVTKRSGPLKRPLTKAATKTPAAATQQQWPATSRGPTPPHSAQQCKLLTNYLKQDATVIKGRRCVVIGADAAYAPVKNAGAKSVAIFGLPESTYWIRFSGRRRRGR